MKNKILSYLLGWFLAILLNLPYRYVHADCADQCKNTSGPTEYTTCMSNCNQKQQQKQEEKDWWEKKDWWSKCNWIKLNTNFPIIWNCIWDDEGEDATKAFPSMIWAFTKIVMALILVVCFILIIYAGILWASDNPWSWTWKWAKWILARVAITILLLWFSGAILKLINPNFFNS